MKCLDFEWLTDEFMLYCNSTQGCRDQRFSNEEDKGIRLTNFLIKPKTLLFHWPE